jgi:hypothetical protein
MKQKLDEARTLAIKLFKAGESEKRKQPKHIWDGQIRTWRDLPSESVAVWDAIAIAAYRELKRPNGELCSGGDNKQ